jgi:hypothetical protein
MLKRAVMTPCKQNLRALQFFSKQAIPTAFVYRQTEKFKIRPTRTQSWIYGEDATCACYPVEGGARVQR